MHPHVRADRRVKFYRDQDLDWIYMKGYRFAYVVEDGVLYKVAQAMVKHAS